ncbi:hypothetical protein DRP05_13440 [Archaeoglobales archaeon]|nr:MAG: hypothetical protein DRP05_13440 [Archaeoglobales archaeon]
MNNGNTTITISKELKKKLESFKGSKDWNEFLSQLLDTLGPDPNNTSSTEVALYCLRKKRTVTISLAGCVDAIRGFCKTKNCKLYPPFTFKSTRDIWLTITDKQFLPLWIYQQHQHQQQLQQQLQLQLKNSISEKCDL